jgi:hypothetical protein
VERVHRDSASPLSGEHTRPSYRDQAQIRASDTKGQYSTAADDVLEPMAKLHSYMQPLRQTKKRSSA